MIGPEGKGKPPKTEEWNMPKRITSLTDTEVRSAKPQDKQYKLFDGGGLFLLVTPQGGKLWRCKYRYDNKEKLLTFGAYPEISLADVLDRKFQPIWPFQHLLKISEPVKREEKRTGAVNNRCFGRKICGDIS